jgi:hypothetical protein
LKLEELSYPDIDQIDRAKSIFFLTFGNLEEHGPHLPVGSDYFVATALRDAMIARLRALHPGYDFVLVPVVPLGEGGANDVAMEFDHIGTFAVRFETLRDVAIDLGSSIARKGFQNILVVHAQGEPKETRRYNAALTYPDLSGRSILGGGFPPPRSAGPHDQARGFKSLWECFSQGYMCGGTWILRPRPPGGWERNSFDVGRLVQ